MLVSADPLWADGKSGVPRHVGSVTSGFQVQFVPGPSYIQLPLSPGQCPCPPRLHFQTCCSELVRSLNGLILVPPVQMSEPVSKKLHNQRDTWSLSPGLLSFVGKSWLFLNLRMMTTKFHILLQMLGTFPGSFFALMAWCYLSAELKHNQETRKNPQS